MFCTHLTRPTAVECTLKPDFSRWDMMGTYIVCAVFIFLCLHWIRYFRRPVPPLSSIPYNLAMNNASMVVECLRS